MITILVILFIVAALILAYLLSISPYFQVERSIDVKCSEQAAFDKVASLDTWKQWNPWLINEPECPLTFSNSSNEQGSYYEWNGFLIGAGRVTHKKMESPATIVQEISFTRPFKSTNKIIWTFAVKNASMTTIKWTMHGKMPLLFRPFAKRMEGMLGPDYELGLVLLRNLLDPTANQLTIHFNEIAFKEALNCVTKPFIENINQMASIMQKEFPKLLKAVGNKQSSVRCAIYKKTIGQDFNFDIAVPVQEDTEAPEGYFLQTIAGGHYFVVEQQGAYEYLRYTWKQAYAHARMKKMQIDLQRHAYEIYENTPLDTAVNDLKTTLYIPIKKIK